MKLQKYVSSKTQKTNGTDERSFYLCMLEIEVMFLQPRKKGATKNSTKANGLNKNICYHKDAIYRSEIFLAITKGLVWPTRGS